MHGYLPVSEALSYLARCSTGFGRGSNWGRQWSPQMAEAIVATELPVGAVGRVSLGWWGVLSLIATEGALFSYLIFSYLYLAVQVGPNWGSEIPPALSFGIPMTGLLV